MIYVFLATGYEEVEALTAVDVLRRASLDVQLVSTENKKVVTSSHNVNIEADILLEECNFEAADALVLPGGLPGAYNLRDNPYLNKAFNEFNDKGKIIAAICAAPLALSHYGVLKGRKATIYPGMEEELINGGCRKATRQDVTVDKNIITGKGPALAAKFALTILREISGENIANTIEKNMLFK